MKIIFFARSHDELAESQYNQMVKVKRECRSLHRYVDEAILGMDFHEEALKWERVFGRENMICRIYDGASRDIIGKFLPCLLFDVDEAAAYRARFAESNRQFTARYLGRATPDLGGRRYSDEDRRKIRAQIARLGLGR